VPSARLNGLVRDLLAEAAEQGITTGELTKLMESMR
jgi:hypothetical protein